MHFLYIIYSPGIDKYYVGETSDIEQRLEQHRSGYFKGSYTSRANDWVLKLKLQFETIEKARKAESFIKRMNSRKFLERLIIESDWLLEKFN